MTVAVDAHELKKHFADVHAVDGLSFKVEPGEIYGLVGPDGAGKTTTMRLLCGGFRPDHGQVTIYGYDVIKQPDQARTQIGYLAQRFSLYGDLTVSENLRFFAEVHGIPTSDWKPRTQEILKFVGLDEFSHRRAGEPVEVVAETVVPLLLVADRQDELRARMERVHLAVDQRPGIVLKRIVAF